MPDKPDPRETARLLEERGCGATRLAVVLGSGFREVAERWPAQETIPYSHLPGFPAPGVAGHAGLVQRSAIRGTPVLLLRGRAHYFEGHSLDHVTFPIRVLAALGVETVLLTNAAGGIRPRLQTGDFMIIRDHINFMGANPLRGPEAAGRPRFVDLSDCYAPHLITLLAAAGRRSGVTLRRGVYLAVSGPSYETPAEIRAFARLGADAVGMSTVPEAIVARQCGLSVAGLSCITNLAAGRANAISHDEVLAQAGIIAEKAGSVLESFALAYAKTQPPKPRSRRH